MFLKVNPTIIIFIIPFFTLNLFAKDHPPKSKEHSNLLTQICLSNFNKELLENNESPNEEVGNYVCNCFFLKVSNGASIINAKSACKEATIKKFKL